MIKYQVCALASEGTHVAYLYMYLQLHYGIQPTWKVHLNNHLNLDSIANDTITQKWKPKVVQTNVFGHLRLAYFEDNSWPTL